MTRRRPGARAALALLCGAAVLVPAVGTTSASFTASADAASASFAAAELGPLTGVEAGHSAAGGITVAWDALVRPDVATEFHVERTVDGVTTVVDVGDGVIGPDDTLPPVGEAVPAVSDVVAGNQGSCAIAAAQLYCWGPYDSANRPVRIGGALAGHAVTDVAIGIQHRCAVADGEAYCWGTGTGVGSTTPAKVGGLLVGKTVTAIAAGSARSCAIADARLYCWGSNQWGTLGDGTTTTRTTPVAVAGALADAEVTDVSLGSIVSCAVADGRAYCWGSGGYGGLGGGTAANSSLPVAVDTSGVLAGRTVTAVAVYYDHVCVLADAWPFCWGLNSSGALGDGTLVASLVPVAVASGELAGRTVTRLSTGYRASCAIAGDEAFCWGRESANLYGDGANGSRTVPTRVAGLSGAVTAMSTAANHVCAVADAAVYCWGSGFDGLLGTGAVTERTEPTAIDTSNMSSIACAPGWRPLDALQRCGAPSDAAIPGFVDEVQVTADTRMVSEISIGGRHSCVVADAAAACWGENSWRQLGDGSMDDRTEPVLVQGLDGRTVTAISPGDSHTCAIADGAAYCWGDGDLGRLGNGGTASSGLPVAVVGLEGRTVTDISTGDSAHSCAVADGVAYCWGWRAGGGVGDGSTEGTQLTAKAVGGQLEGHVVSRVVVARNLSCAVADLGTRVFCWGSGEQGRLGNGDTADHASPVPVVTSGVLAGRTITDIAVSSYPNTEATVCVVADADPFCWGSGTSGVLGNDTTAFSTVPVAVTTGGDLVAGTSRSISGGARSMCVVADGVGVPICWGQVVTSNLPVAVTVTGMPAAPVEAVAVGSTHTCVVAAGRPYCWGGTEGLPLLGDGSLDASTTVVPVTTVGALTAGGCPSGWVAVGAAMCAPGPTTDVSYRISYGKRGWWSPSVVVDAAWTGGA